MLASGKALETMPAACTFAAARSALLKQLAALQRLIKARLPNNSAIPRCSLATANDDGLARCLAILAAAQRLPAADSKSAHVIKTSDGPRRPHWRGQLRRGAGESRAIGRSHRFVRSQRRRARQGRAAERPGKRRHNDVVHCTDSALTGKDWTLLERDACPVWVRTVNEFGNDVVKGARAEWKKTETVFLRGRGLRALFRRVIH